MRYTKQRHKRDCGAAVLANSVKWAGQRFNYSKHKDVLIEMLEIEEHDGTFPLIFQNIIIKYDMPFKVVATLERPKYKEIVDHLKDNGAIILWYRNGKYSYHVSLIIKYEDGKFYFVNHLPTEKITQLTHLNIKKMLKFSPLAIMIKKN